MPTTEQRSIREQVTAAICERLGHYAHPASGKPREQCNDGLMADAALDVLLHWEDLEAVLLHTITYADPEIVTLARRVLIGLQGGAPTDTPASGACGTCRLALSPMRQRGTSGAPEMAAAEILAGFSGILRCEKCSATQELGDTGRHLANGWPKCCGLTMTWWTQQQIDAGEMPR